VFLYYTWALTEKTLSYVPGGKAFYRAVGRVVKSRAQGTGEQISTAFPTARKAKELVPSGGAVLDVGTGWFHHDAFLLYLVGDYKIYLFDIEDRAQLNYIRNYLGNLLENVEVIARELNISVADAREKLRELISLPDRRSIYSRCNFVPCITDHVDEPFLPEGSIDFMVSNCVLVHIRPELLMTELVTLRRILRDDGFMYHMLGHDDHWAFHDPSVSWPSFNYLRYSETTYKLLFDTKLEYHNRLVKPEWLDVFTRAGLRVEEYETEVTDESRASVRSLPRLDARYASYPLDDLAAIHSYVLLAKQRPDHDGEAPARPNRDHEPAEHRA
jgi:hypothetical protein